MTIDIHETDPGTGYSVAEHIVSELRTAGSEGLSAAEIASLIGEPRTQRIAAWLRDLRAKGLAYKEQVSPGSTRVRWYASTTTGSPIPDPLNTLAEEIRSELEEALGRGSTEYEQGIVAGLSVAVELVARQQRLQVEMHEEYLAVEADAKEKGYRVQWAPEPKEER